MSLFDEIKIAPGDDIDINEGDPFVLALVAVSDTQLCFPLLILNNPTDWMQEFWQEDWQTNPEQDTTLPPRHLSDQVLHALHEGLLGRG
jgi:hypothetical protein